ncbi:putative inorganic phosphate cotransporter [Nephila pilipes]|uniref:Putative inorganic phosphate cotransporter n=1 Tax=Nephila pilipes TaxID=299642 RepID=A0A8X6PL33_NEPPI|nr:putative inorganic phosphate cotransporter [Nephila pilipes]
MKQNLRSLITSKKNFSLKGASGCFWLILWTFFVFETPDLHPRICRDELLLIRQGRDSPQLRPPTPWKSIVTSIPFWALLVTHLGESWGFYTLLIQMPMYLSNILHFDINQNGILSALPSLMLSIVSILTSVLADKLRANSKLRITTIRKILNSIAVILSTTQASSMTSFAQLNHTLGSKMDAEENTSGKMKTQLATILTQTQRKFNNH